MSEITAAGLPDGTFPAKAVSNVRSQIVLNLPLIQFDMDVPASFSKSVQFLRDVLTVAPLSDRSNVRAFYADLIEQLEAQLRSVVDNA